MKVAAPLTMRWRAVPMSMAGRPFCPSQSTSSWIVRDRGKSETRHEAGGRPTGTAHADRASVREGEPRAGFGL
eukprot:4444290-Pyramimonas_sp.AAC.1